MASDVSAASACTCVLGHLDHAEDCYCTTSVCGCPIHRDTEIGRVEAELLAGVDDKPLAKPDDPS